MAESQQRLVSLSGTPGQKSASGTTNPGSEVTIYSELLAANRKLTLAYISCTQDGIFRIKDDGNIIGVARIASGVVNASFSWVPYLEIQSGRTLTLTFEAASYTLPVGYNAFVQGLD